MSRIAFKSELVRAPVVSVTRNGIIFPANDGLTGATQFKFTSTALIHQYPSTYIWKSKYSFQHGYYTNFFYDHDGAAGYNSDLGYFGCHPYPREGYTLGDTLLGTTDNFEISCDGKDWTGASVGGDPNTGSAGTTHDALDDNENSTLVSYNQWYTHAMVITAASSVPTIKFYYDLGTGITRVITHVFSGAMPANTGSPTLTWGSSPWTGTQVSETLGGTLRGLQLYSTNLSTADILTEAANDTLDAAQTTSGQANLWYINQNLKPTDITDKSGNAHHPAWLGADHGTLYTG